MMSFKQKSYPTFSSLTPPYCNNHYNMQLNNPINQNNPLFFEVRKIQDSGRCLMVSIPKRFTNWMRIGKGSLVKIEFNSDENMGNRIIIERVRLGESED
jgi:hypothetical protein